MAYGFLIGLVYMNLWDPCALVRIPSARTCSFQFVLHETFLSYTEVKEEFYCLIPGTRFTIERKGTLLTSWPHMDACACLKRFLSSKTPQDGILESNVRNSE